MKKGLTGTQSDRKIPDLLTWQKNIKAHALPLTAAGLDAAAIACRQDKQQINRLSLIHISEPRDRTRSRMPSSA